MADKPVDDRKTKMRNLLKAVKQCRGALNYYNELKPIKNALADLEKTNGK